MLHPKTVFEKVVAASERLKLVLLVAHHLNQTFEDITPISALRHSDVCRFWFSEFLHREIQKKETLSLKEVKERRQQNCEFQRSNLAPVRCVSNFKNFDELSGLRI